MAKRAISPARRLHTLVLIGPFDRASVAPHVFSQFSRKLRDTPARGTDFGALSLVYAPRLRFGEGARGQSGKLAPSSAHC